MFLNFPSKYNVRSSQGMDEHDKKYHEFIASAISNIAKVADDNVKFDKYYNQLHAVVPKYGLSLNEFTILLDIVIDPHSEFKSMQKNKLLTLFYCRDLLDFNSVLKIVSVFKVPSYYNKRSTTVLLSRALQTKLSNFLLKNYVNIRWEKRFLHLLNLLFDLLSIGYLRLNVGYLVIYLLHLSAEIDPFYNKRYFYTAKKLNSLLEFYELDKESTIPLLLSFAEYLSSTERSQTFDSIYSKYLLILSDLKVPKDVFGKINIPFIGQLTLMKNLGNIDHVEMHIFQQNVILYVQLIASLNQSLAHTFNNATSRKRKYLEDEDLGSMLRKFPLREVFSSQRLSREICDQSDTYKTSAISLLKFLSTINPKNLQIPDHLTGLSPGYRDPLFTFYAPILLLIINCQLNFFDQMTSETLQIKEGTLYLTLDMHWIFKGLAKFCELHPNHSLLPCLQDIFAGQINVVFHGQPDDIIQILNVHEFLQFFEPNYIKYKTLLENVIKMIFKLDHVKLMRGIVLLASNWISEPSELEKLLTLVLENLKLTGHLPHNEILLLASLMQSIPYSTIDITQLVFCSDFMSLTFFSGDLFKLNLLLKHVSFCKKYFSDYGLKQIEDSFSRDSYGRLRALKELHNSYVMDLCNFLWRNRAFDTKDVSSGRFFGFPSRFVDRLEQKPTDLAHFPSTRLASLTEGESENSKQDDMGDARLAVLLALKKHKYTGVVEFLQSSIRGLNN